MPVTHICLKVVQQTFFSCIIYRFLIDFVLVVDDADDDIRWCNALNVELINQNIFFAKLVTRQVFSLIIRKLC